MSWIVWTLWVVLFAAFEGWALLTRRYDDTLTNNTRRLFRTRTSKTGRVVFTVSWCGFALWFLLHILA
ncbi:hypothetical protein ABT024_04835 [Streptomyces sp. NPDC002812]|uniref:hypothetical protein n=1 Tax=Streptomyces sp. NPDC002812 TaxID=3154434 RepID=UPI00331B608F